MRYVTYKIYDQTPNRNIILDNNNIKTSMWKQYMNISQNYQATAQIIVKKN